MAIQAQRTLHDSRETQIRRFTSREFERLVEVGIIREDERVELIEGEIIKMSPIGKHHQACVDRLTMSLAPLIAGKAILRGQGPVQLAEYTQLQPDIAVLRFKTDYYWERLPEAGDALLVIEVSDTTLTIDRQVKLPIYAAAAIPEVWIVNLPEGIIEAYSNPSKETYREVRRLQLGEAMSLPGFPDVVIRVEDVLG